MQNKIYFCNSDIAKKKTKGLHYQETRTLCLVHFSCVQDRVIAKKQLYLDRYEPTSNLR